MGQCMKASKGKGNPQKNFNELILERLVLMKKVALSTDNKNKVKEMLAILSKYDFEIVTKSKLGVTEEFEEIYDTLEENSKLKAEKLREYVLLF